MCFANVFLKPEKKQRCKGSLWFLTWGRIGQWYHLLGLEAQFIPLLQACQQVQSNMLSLRFLRDLQVFGNNGKELYWLELYQHIVNI